jgi:hypothetical protein
MDRPNPPPAAAILEGPEGLRAEDGLVLHVGRDGAPRCLPSRRR